MKTNVDLTENLDFFIPAKKISNRSTISFAVCSYDTSILGAKLHKNIVNIPYCIEMDIEHRQRGGIIQGNGYRRVYMKSCEKPGFYCERCGRTKKYAWEDFSQLVCSKCEKELKRNYNKFPWKEE